MMAEATVMQFPARIEWFWQTRDEPPKWYRYSDVENILIEEAFQAKQDQVILDTVQIDFVHQVQICSDNNNNPQSVPVKREVKTTRDKILREDRFIVNPIHPDMPFCHASTDSIFLVATKQQISNMCFKNTVEIVAEGIAQEGKKLGRQREAQWMANELLKVKNGSEEEIWRCCARLYSMESFLYKKLNEAMRLVDDKKQRHIWQQQISTLGPFAVLLDRITVMFERPAGGFRGIIYRGANLSKDQITKFKEIATSNNPYRSFQAFTSCSRNRTKAESFGNTLFIITQPVHKLSTNNDISPYSDYDEEEELLSPAYRFRIRNVEFNVKKKKHYIYLDG
ncbi:unnamed protein product [Adineta steineri]|uniref:NAD(P)(+)--arginine ADP-ribosyltransferase n=1 Tax=Adineta steineri TaxID=433720 RepID=A0A813ZL17_9BILA|nr:unnamed protein product [Adineta steineri]CAF3815594.1 unnamed protein product [Adineta steineri]